MFFTDDNFLKSNICLGNGEGKCVFEQTVVRRIFVTTFHRSGYNQPSKISELFEGFLKQAGTWNRHNNSRNNGSISPRRTLAPLSLSDDGMMFLL